MNWFDCIESFIKVVESGSFIGAARLQHTTSSAITKRIQWLEQSLQTQLLQRSTRNLNLTVSGKQFYNRVTGLLHEWDAIKADTQALRQEMKGHLRVAASPWLGRFILNDLVQQFLKKYPDVGITLMLCNHVTDLQMEEYDLIVTGKTLVYDRVGVEVIDLGKFYRSLYASKCYIQERGTPRSIAELKQHDLITVSMRDDGHDFWEIGGKQVEVIGRFRTDQMDFALQAVENDLGIANLSGNVFKAKGKKSNDLVRVLPKLQSQAIDCVLAFQSQRYISYLMESFIDYIVDESKVWFM